MIDTCYIGDVRDGLRAMIAAGVRAQTCVTSPPYWGLRDYGTGQWSGGDPAHEHDRVAARNGRGGSGSPGKNPEGAFPSEYPADVCSCGARRVDHQLGLEATPAEYLRNMVDVFRLVRDVLADDGCIWVNMGDSYAGSRCGGETDASTLGGSRESQEQSKHARASFRRDRKVTPRSDVKVSGIKPKDLVGMPWRLALALQEDGWWLRSDIIWAKPNPMPESCTDRPTKSHEYLFLLAKSEIYYYDADAIKEPASEDTHARYARGRSDTHKYADGGPGDQTIAKSFEHMRDDRQIHKPVAGWATGDYFHDAVSHAKAKDERHGKLLKHPGNGVGFGHGYDENVKPRVAGVNAEVRCAG